MGKPRAYQANRTCTEYAIGLISEVCRSAEALMYTFSQVCSEYMGKQNIWECRYARLKGVVASTEQTEVHQEVVVTFNGRKGWHASITTVPRCCIDSCLPMNAKSNVSCLPSSSSCCSVCAAGAIFTWICRQGNCIMATACLPH